MKAHQDKFSLKRMYALFGIQRSGYYGWLKKVPGKRAQANADLDKKHLTVIYPPFSEDKVFSVDIGILGCGKVKYVDKQKKLDINEPFAISENARAKSNEYLHEKEVRVHINTS